MTDTTADSFLDNIESQIQAFIVNELLSTLNLLGAKMRCFLYEKSVVEFKNKRIEDVARMISDSTSALDFKVNCEIFGLDPDSRFSDFVDFWLNHVCCLNSTHFESFLTFLDKKMQPLYNVQFVIEMYNIAKKFTVDEFFEVKRLLKEAKAKKKRKKKMMKKSKSKDKICAALSMYAVQRVHEICKDPVIDGFMTHPDLNHSDLERHEHERLDIRFIGDAFKRSESALEFKINCELFSRDPDVCIKNLMRYIAVYDMYFTMSNFDIWANTFMKLKVDIMSFFGNDADLMIFFLEEVNSKMTCESFFDEMKKIEKLESKIR